MARWKTPDPYFFSITGANVCATIFPPRTKNVSVANDILYLSELPVHTMNATSPSTTCFSNFDALVFAGMMSLNMVVNAARISATPFRVPFGVISPSPPAHNPSISIPHPLPENPASAAPTPLPSTRPTPPLNLSSLSLASRFFQTLPKEMLPPPTSIRKSRSSSWLADRPRRLSG